MVMTIKELKKGLGLTNRNIAELFDLSLMSYANSSAKLRYESALCKFYDKIKEKINPDEQNDLKPQKNENMMNLNGKTW